ncbi:hypothetical protein LLG96_09825 [bacterium]|nr:hypothetical protein [bacterium]
MTIYIRRVFLPLIFLLCGFNPVFAQESLELKAIIDGADIGDMMITSGNGNLVYEYTRVDSMSSRALELDQEHIASADTDTKTIIRNYEKLNITFSFSGSKVRCNESSYNRLPNGKWYPQDWQWAYNGEKLDLLRLDGLDENGLIVPRGSVRTEYVSRLNRFDPRYNGMKIMGTSVGTFLRGSIGDKNVENIKLMPEETIDSIPCKVVRGYVPNTTETITVWLAPGIMNHPKRIEYLSGDELTVVNNNFKEFKGGIWFPESVAKELFYRGPAGKWILYVKEKITIQNDFDINIDLPASLFEIQFPAGLWVYDYRLGEKIESK